MLVSFDTAHSIPDALAAVARRADTGAIQAQVVCAVIIARRTRPIAAVRTGTVRRATVTAAGEYEVRTVSVAH